ncbi:MAG TPA: LysE family transporter [Chitinophagales bacterium]|nr:LysE family transporter [Chitinophagales bacterium]
MGNAIWQGLLTGLVLATFTGPIFFAVIDLGLKGHTKGAAYLAFGTFTSDILTVLFIYAVAKTIDRNSPVLQGMYIGGGLLLVGLGLQNIFKAKPVDPHTPLNHESGLRLYSKGFLINISNPNVFFFWFGAVMVAVHGYRNRPELVLAHFITALLVVFATDFLKGYGASLLRPYIKGNILLYLSRLSGLVLIYFGIKLIVFH